MSRASFVFQHALLAAFAIFFVWWLRNPPYKLHAIIHVVPTWLAIATLLLSTRCFPLSNASFVFVVTFLTLHAVGSRYIYSFVPYDEWAMQLFGSTISERFDLSRNHYDRFVHFSYGLLIAPVVAEMSVRFAHIPPRWRYVEAIQFVLASSAFFELAEWLGAISLAPNHADSYLGQQGDLWDAHKDMALAAGGSVLSLLIAWTANFLSSRKNEEGLG